MKKVTTLILLFCCMMAQANNLYLFTNASKTITAGGYIGPEKTNDEISKYSEEVRQGQEIGDFRVGGLQETKSVDSVSDFVNKTIETVGDNAFMVAGLTATGGVGVGLMGIEMAGSKAKEMRDEETEFGRLSDEAKNNGKKSFEFNGKKYNVGDKLYGDIESYVIPVAWGSTSLLPMVNQLKYLRGAKGAINAIEKEFPDLIRKTLAQKTKESVSKYIGHSLSLAKDLKVMGFSQNVLDDYAGKDVDYFKTALDISSIREAFTLHTMNMISANLMSKVAKPYMTNKEAALIDADANLIFDLNNRLKDPSITAEDKKIIKL